MQHFSGLTENVLHQKEGISHTKERLRFIRHGSDKEINKRNTQANKEEKPQTDSCVRSRQHK